MLSTDLDEMKKVWYNNTIQKKKQKVDKKKHWKKLPEDHPFKGLITVYSYDTTEYVL